VERPDLRQDTRQRKKKERKYRIEKEKDGDWLGVKAKKQAYKTTEDNIE
jgi:hypothetical protein